MPGQVGVKIVVEGKPVHFMERQPFSPSPGLDERNVIPHQFPNQFDAHAPAIPFEPAAELGCPGIGDAQDLSAAGRVGPVVKEPLQVGRK